jgi:E3 ubiquitin-protein ligase SHPRH
LARHVAIHFLSVPYHCWQPQGNFCQMQPVSCLTDNSCLLVQTVEVLACILKHRCKYPAHFVSLEERIKALRKPECVSCEPCGTHADDPEDPKVQQYFGTWVQCDGCEAWMHSACANYNGNANTSFLCKSCLQSLARELVPGIARATLIVCPESILQQWKSEIRKHTVPGMLKVYHYTGHKSPTSSSKAGVIFA